MMAHRNASEEASTHHYSTLRRLETAIRQLTRARGLTGDPILPVPAVSTLDGELTAISLWLEVPTDLRCHPAAWRMARAAVSGRW